MVQFRPHAREVIAKIVYYGPPLGGKTTNLRTLYEGYPKHTRGELAVVPAGADRTIYFDFLPLDIGTLRNLKLRVQLYTVPGQVEYNSTRQLVLRGVDGVVFVADSQRSVLAANLESWLNLKENLAMQGLNPADVPIVIQYNKRDISEILDVESLDEFLNEFNAPFFEAVATVGIGVQETLGSAVKLVVRSLRDRFQISAEGHSTAEFSGAVEGEPAPARFGREPAPGVVVPFGGNSGTYAGERGPTGGHGEIGSSGVQAGVTQPVPVPGPKPVPEDTLVSQPKPGDHFLGHHLPEPLEQKDPFDPEGSAASLDEDLFRVDSDSPTVPEVPPAFSPYLPEAEEEPEAPALADSDAGEPFGPVGGEVFLPESELPRSDRDSFGALPAPPTETVDEERPQRTVGEETAFAPRDPAEITLPPRDLQGFLKSREPDPEQESSPWADIPLVTVEGKEPSGPALDDRSLVFATTPEPASRQSSIQDEDWRSQNFPDSYKKPPETTASEPVADPPPSSFQVPATEQHADPFGSVLASEREEIQGPTAEELDSPVSAGEAVAFADQVEDLDDPFGPADPLEEQELELEAPAMQEISDQLTAARESERPVPSDRWQVGRESDPFGPESEAADKQQDESDWFGAGAKSRPAQMPPDSGVGSPAGESLPELEFAGVPEDLPAGPEFDAFPETPEPGFAGYSDQPPASPAVTREADSAPLESAFESPPDVPETHSVGEDVFFGQQTVPQAQVQGDSNEFAAGSSLYDDTDEQLPEGLPEDPWSDDVVLPPERPVPTAPRAAGSAAARETEQDRVLSIPVSALRQVPARALAQYGDVRELEIEVPVPALWTGGKRITLQLRMTLIPQEEDDGGSDHHS